MEGITRLIDEFGLEFYETALKKMFDDSEIQARERLKRKRDIF